MPKQPKKTPAASLSDDVLEALGTELGLAISESRGAASELLNRVAGWRDQYAGVLPPKPNKWQSNVHIPETKSAVKTAQIAIARAALYSDPIFEVEADDPEYEDEAAEVESFCEFWHRRTRLATKGSIAIREALITGQCWLKPGIQPTGKTLPDALPPALKPNQLDVKPTCDYVITEDMCLLPFTAKSFNHANGAFARCYIRWQDIEDAGKAGIFYKQAVDTVKNTWQESLPPTQIQDQQGLAPVVPQNLYSSTFECWEGVYRWKRPEDVREKEWLITVAFREDIGGNATVLRCSEYQPLYGNQWFFIPIICDPEPNSMWGSSMCQDIQGMQNWVNATFNQATDAVTLAILPPVAVPPTSEVYRRNLKWGPMEKWPLNNPAEAQVMSVAPTMMAGVQAAMGQMPYVRQATERITGTNDLMQGKQENQQRTAYEIGARVEAGNSVYEYHVSTIQLGQDDTQGFEAYAACFMNILRLYMPQYPIAYQSGEGGGEWPVFKPAVYEGDYRFVPHGTTASNNPQVRFQRAVTTRQAVTQSPFCQLSPADTMEALVAKVQRWYHAEREYFQATGNKHVEAYLGPEPKTPEEAIAVAFKVDPMSTQAIMQRYQPQPLTAPGQGMVPGALPAPGPGAESGFGGPQGTGGVEGGGAGIPGLTQPPGMAQV